MSSKNMKKNSYNREVETTCCFSGLVKWGGTICVAAVEGMTWCFWSPVYKRKWIPMFALSHEQKGLGNWKSSSNSVTRETTPNKLKWLQLTLSDINSLISSIENICFDFHIFFLCITFCFFKIISTKIVYYCFYRVLSEVEFDVKWQKKDCLQIYQWCIK